MTGDDHQLARDRAGRDVAAAKCGDAPMKGRAGGRSCGPCATRLREQPADLAWALLAHAAVLGRPTDLLGSQRGRLTSLNGGRLTTSCANAAWIWFFSRVRCRTSSPRRETSGRCARVASSGRHHFVEQADDQQVCEDLGVDAIGLRSLNMSVHGVGLASTTRHT